MCNLYNVDIGEALIYYNKKLYTYDGSIYPNNKLKEANI